jgi:HrpA-like RNA helicase
MTQFPVARLPESCDRRADYLWQRAGREYRPAKGNCLRRFNGADYLWMAGLLIEEIERPLQ